MQQQQQPRPPSSESNGRPSSGNRKIVNPTNVTANNNNTSAGEQRPVPPLSLDGNSNTEAKLDMLTSPTSDTEFDDEMLLSGDGGNSITGNSHSRIGSAKKFDDSSVSNVNYLSNNLMPILAKGLETLLIEVETDPNIRPLRWLAQYLKDRNIQNTEKRAQQLRDAALELVDNTTASDQVYWNCCNALRSVMWPCTAHVALMREIEETVETDPPPPAETPPPVEPALPQQPPEAERSKSPDQKRPTKTPDKAAAAAAPPAKGGKGGKQQEVVQEVVPEPEPEPVVPVKYYKNVKSVVLKHVSTSHIDKKTIEGMFIRKTQGVSWTAVRSGFTVVVKDVQLEENMHFWAQNEKRHGSYVAVPLCLDGKVVGVVTVDTMMDERVIEEEDIDFIEQIAEITGSTMVRVRREEVERREKEERERIEREREAERLAEVQRKKEEADRLREETGEEEYEEVTRE